MTTYRNDHEAALARVDALEQELDKLRTRDVERAPTPERRSRKPWPLFAASIAALVAGIVGGVALGAANPPAPAKPAPVASTPIDRSLLERCADAIAPTPLLDADRTDPHAASPASVEAIARTGAPCRDELHALLDDTTWSADERDALWQWAVYEDELAGAISRIEVYYASDPYQLDGYSTAQQLWVEYDRAYYQRNRALVAWRAVTSS